MQNIPDNRHNIPVMKKNKNKCVLYKNKIKHLIGGYSYGKKSGEKGYYKSKGGIYKNCRALC